MAKVSKNIKKLRTDKKMTQDALAEKINVTRQTISSWENDRTQPDIDMLVLLANAFDIGVEELIYGEKRNYRHRKQIQPFNRKKTYKFI